MFSELVVFPYVGGAEQKSQVSALGASQAGAAVFISLERFQCGQRRRSLLLESREGEGERKGELSHPAGRQADRIGDIRLFAHLKRTVEGSAAVDLERGCMNLHSCRLRRPAIEVEGVSVCRLAPDSQVTNSERPCICNPTCLVRTGPTHAVARSLARTSMRGGGGHGGGRCSVKQR